MSKFNYSSEEEIKQMLEKMPKVRDKRSKEEIYRNVMKQSQSRQSQSTKKKWVVPAFSAAALLLLLVLIPNLMNFTSQTSPDESSQSSGDSADIGTLEKDSDETQEDSGRNTESSEAEREEAIPERSTEDGSEENITEEPSIELEKEPFSYENYVTAVRQEDVGEEETAVTVPLKNEQASVIVPVSFVVSGMQNSIDVFEQWMDQYNGEEIGLDSSPLRDVDWSDGGGGTPAEADFMEEEAVVSSAESEMIVRSLEESLRFLDETEVNLFENEEPGVDLGNYGVVETYSAEQNNRGYYAYTSDANMTFLVSQNAAGLGNMNQNEELLTLDETLEQMQSPQENSSVKASIPETVSIDEVEEEGDLARVVFSEDSEFPNSENTQLMIEAILLTASDFDLNRVSFEGTDGGEMEGYNLDEPVDIPVAPNQVATSN